MPMLHHYKYLLLTGRYSNSFFTDIVVLHVTSWSLVCSLMDLLPVVMEVMPMCLLKVHIT